MAMELRHLRFFIAVAEEGHITRAAERLGIQQPPLSQRIKAIERELDVQLFRRKARGVELTEAGRVFLDNARAMLAHNERAIDSTRRTARGEQGRLCVGVTPTGPFHPFVPRVIRAFREAFPLVSLTLEECLSPELLIRLRNEQMDAAFLRTPMAEPEHLVIAPLIEEPMVVALPNAHALVQNDGDRAALSLKDLAGETFIVYARQHGPGLYDATTVACLKAGFSPRLGQEAPRVTSALGLVAAGLGISVVPASMQRMAMDGVAYRRLKGAAQPKAVLTLASRRGDPSAVVRNFLSLVRRTAKNFQADSEKAA
ncbi:LysR substrate-binding domain-containing protein [Afipia sp. GAS231]|uniref:LysR substrate-binding domain-containing protein n=1 Tax=Afipia sp. GAS231 TaxID=1882747 RepID=UPI000B873028|nr:LysR substrate-binding domain-containing protein [Afipia sp. GAS231]